jgi:hypothetical protein
LETLKEGIIAFGARAFPVKEIIAALGAGIIYIFR